MKKAMKWLSIVLCVALICTAFTACGGGSATTTTNGQSSESTTADDASSDETTTETETIPLADDQVFNIGICQLLQHEALDAATKGFKEALIAKLGEDHVKFDTQTASGEKTKANFVMLASNMLITIRLMNCESAMPTAMPTIKETMPMIKVSVSKMSETLRLLMPRVK